LIEARLDERLPPDVRAELERHLADCPECQAEWAELARLREALAAAAARPLQPLDARAAWLRLEPGLRRARGGPGRALGWAVSAAAAAGLLLAAAWMWNERPRLAPGSEPAPAAAADPGTPSAWPVESRHGLALGLVPGATAGQELWPEGAEVRLEAGARLALQPLEGMSLRALDGASLTLRSPPGAGLRLGLTGGLVVVHLGRETRPGGLEVEVPHGALLALGTAFLVAVDAEGGAEVALQQGSLRVVPARGPTLRLEGPCLFSLGPDGLGPCAPIPEALRLRLAAELVDASRQDARIAWLGYLAPVSELAPVARPSSRPHPENAPPDPLARARKLLAARRVPEALSLLERYLTGRPEDGHARMLRADALRLGGRAPAARAAYLELAREAAGAAEREAALFQAGLLALRELEEPARALEDFEELRRLFPRGLLRQEVALHLAECYLAQADYPRARRALEDYLRLYPAGTQAEKARAWLGELEAKGWR
jgi:hypothetical protein